MLPAPLSTHINIPPYLGDYDSWEDEQNAQAQQILDNGKVDILMGDFNSGIETETINAYTPEAYDIIVDGVISRRTWNRLQAVPGASTIQSPVSRTVTSS